MAYWGFAMTNRGNSVVWRLLTYVAIIALVAGSITTLKAAPSDPVADAELGQIDFVHNTANFIDGRSINSSCLTCQWLGVTIDGLGHLYFADVGNSRVLGWLSASGFTNGQPADLVIGQPDQWTVGCVAGNEGMAVLCNPTAVAGDSQGNLYVTDSGNNRILFFPNPFAQSGQVTATFSLTDSNEPQGIAVDSNGNLYMAEIAANRVVEYNEALGNPSNTTPSFVFGQDGSMSTTGCNDGTNSGDVKGLGPDSLCGPQDVAVDPSNNVYIADTNNVRVLEFNEPLAGPPDNSVANQVYGQGGSFTTKNPNNGGLSGRSLEFPAGVAVDLNSNVYIADTFNQRVLEFNAPQASNPVASLVLGQSAANTNICNGGVAAGDLAGVGPDALCIPTKVAVDASGNIYVVDLINNRLPVFDQLSNPPTNNLATRVLGQADLIHSTVNFVAAKSLNFPSAVAVDPRSGANHPLYVSDPENNRALAWPDAASFANGDPALMVFGQADPFSVFTNGPSSNPGPGTLNTAGNGGTLLGVNPITGELALADFENGRVLIYLDPFGSSSGCTPAANGSGCPGDTIADFVIGQPNFQTIGVETINRKSVGEPRGVAFDNFGNLYVTDNFSRILEYDAGTFHTNGPDATRVFGQNGNFNGLGCNAHGVGPTSVCSPFGMAFDAFNDLYVADNGNNRVLVFLNPVGSPGNCVPAADGSGCPGDTTADFVIGPPNFTENLASQSTFSSPYGIAFD